MPQVQHISYQRVLLMVFLIVTPMLFPAYAFAHQAQATAGGPTILKVSVGFDGIYQDGNWIPIQIDLGNTGNDFKGKIAIGVPSAPTNGAASTKSTNTYQEDIDLPPGAQKQVTISVPFNQALQGSNSTGSINLIDSTNHVIAHKALTPNTNNSGLTLIGVLSDTPNNFNQLNLAISALLGTSGQIKSLTAATLPTQAAVLKNFDVLVIDNFTTSTLSKDQLAALQNWVNQGGALIVTGGPEWKRTLSGLDSTLLPVTAKSNGTLPAGTHLLPINDMTKHDDTLKSAVAISIAQPAAGSTPLLSAGNIPIITQIKQGQGITYYLAYDPTIEPLASWPQTNQIWSSLLIRPLADQILTAAAAGKSNVGPSNTMSWQKTSYNTSTMVNMIQTFFPNAYPSIWLVLLLLISYILILGPVRLIIIRVFKRRDWTWRIVLGTILVFTLLSYGLALHQKGSSIITSSIAIEQLQAPDSTGTTGQVTTFVGVFVPSQGDFQVNIPGTSLVQPADQTNSINYSPNPPGSDQQSIFNLGTNGTNIDLQGVDIWTTRTLIAQHDTHTLGAITSQLQLQQNIVSGTVTSSLPYGLSDAFVLVGKNYVSIGELPANSSKQVSINLASNKNQGPNSILIADQIAASRGLRVPTIGGISGVSNNNDLLDPMRRHASMLEAMSGGYCDNNNGCFNQGIPVFSNGGAIVKQYMINGSGQGAQDPLLLPGSAATIIGWTKSPFIQNGNITVNGQNTNDTQETLVQAPLDVRLTGNTHIPSELIHSQIVQIQPDSRGTIQEEAPDIYMLQTGSMTFEYSLPAVQIQQSTLTFTSSANVNQIIGQGTGTTTSINDIKSYLYNWQTGNWDAITFKNLTSSVKAAQPYIGPGNRILLHVSNNASNALFDKPALDVQGTIIH